MRRISGFTLIELLFVLLILSILTPLFFLNLDVIRQDETQMIFRILSVEFSLLRERAVTQYEARYVEFDLASGTLKTGNLDEYKGFQPEREIGLPSGYAIKDVVINGEKYTTGKCFMRFHPTGFVDRTIIHFQKEDEKFYTVIVEPLTCKVRQFDGYVEETYRKERADIT